MKKMILILLLGRNLLREDGTGILNEALALFPDREVWIVHAPRERLTPPEGHECISVDEAILRLSARQETQGWDVLLVANGGQTAQVVPLVAALCSGYDGYWGVHKVVDLQQDGARILEEDLHSKDNDSVPLGRASKEAVREVYFNTAW